MGTRKVQVTNSLKMDANNFNNHIYKAISFLTNARIELGETNYKKNRGSKRTADGHEKKYINREIGDILKPEVASLSESLNFNFHKVLFHLTGVEASTVRSYKTSLGKFNNFILEHQQTLLIPKSFKTSCHIITFCKIIGCIIQTNPQFLQVLMDDYLMWTTFHNSKGTVKNLDSGPIFFGSFLATGRFPRISKDLKQRAKKLAKPGTGGATPFPDEKIPLLFFEWLLSQENLKDMWSGVFYGLMFYGTLRPTITYTLSPKCFKFIDKHGEQHPKPSRHTKKVLLEVFQFKNQQDHEKPKRLSACGLTGSQKPKAQLQQTSLLLYFSFLIDAK